MKKLVSIFLIALMPLSLIAQSVQEGLRFAEVDKFENAKKVFKNLYKQTPSASHAYYLGNLYYTLEKEDSAKIYFTEGIQLDPAYAMNHVGLGKTVYPINPSEGKKSFDKALELSKSKDNQVLMGIAEFYINYTTGNNKYLEVPQAFTLLDIAIKNDKKSPDPLLLKGDGYWRIYDGSKAVQQYEAALALNPKYAKTLMKLGESYKNVKNYNRALEYYDKVLALDAAYARAYKDKGDAFYRNKQYDKAIESYKKYVSMADPNDDVDLKYAAFLIQNRDFNNALTLLNRLETKKDINPITFRLLAIANYEKGENQKGLDNMEKFWAKADSKKYVITDYEYYGKLLAKAGKDSLAVVNLEKAISMDSSRIDLYGDLGSSYLRTKNYTKSAQALEKKIKKSPMTNDYFNLGLAYYYDKKFADADTTFGTLIKYLPTYAHGYLWRAKVKSSMDPTSENGLAKPYFEKFIDLTKGEADKNKKDLLTAYDYLGYYYLIKKDKPKAKEAYTKMKELDPSNKKADDGLKIVNAK